jgi:hypothetical protein
MIKLVAVGGVPLLHNKPIWTEPQETKQMMPVTRHKPRVYPLLVAERRCSREHLADVLVASGRKTGSAPWCYSSTSDIGLSSQTEHRLD